MYDIDGKGKVTFKDLVKVLWDLTWSSMSEKQREVFISYNPGFKVHIILDSIRFDISRWKEVGLLR